MATFRFNGESEVNFYSGTTISKDKPVTLDDEFFIEKARAVCAQEGSLLEEVKTVKKKAKKKAK